MRLDWYMFLSAGYRFLVQRGIKKLRLQPELNGAVHLIPIQVLIENVVRLSEKRGSESLEVYHCTGQLVPAEEVCRAAERVVGLRLLV